MESLAVNLPRGFDGVEEIDYCIRRKVLRTPGMVTLSDVINGRTIEVRLYKDCVNVGVRNIDMIIDGEVMATTIVNRDSHDFAFRIAKSALMALKSKVGKHSRHTRNRNLRLEEVA